MMSLGPYACHLTGRIAAVGVAVAIVWMTMAQPNAGAAKADEDAGSDDPLTRVKRNIVLVLDWDQASGKAVLGSGILLQRDKAIIPCRIAGAGRNLGVGQQHRRSEARLSGERAGRGLCALKIAHPVHFDPLPLDIRPIEEVAIGDSVYAVSAGPGREISMVKARISGISGAGENKVIRISRHLNATSAGSALFDRSGALLGINAAQAAQGEDTAFSYPMESYLQMEQVKA